MNYLSTTRKPFSHLLLSFSSPSSQPLFISLFSTSSSSLSSSSSSSRRHHHDEESRNVKVSVWWDIENCSVPNGINVFRIAQSITSAVRFNGIKGPVQISAFGDVQYLSRPNQEALSSTGISLIHVPQGGRNSADRSLLVDLMYWVSQNPPPAHIFLISSDRDFAGILHRLRMNNYNILLAGKDDKRTPSVLCSAASIMWHWNELAKGENLSGRHFNQPPDGPFNSWYGHYRGPLENPFDAPEQQGSSKANNPLLVEPLSDKNHPTPKAVLKQIRQIVNSYPNGLSIVELRAQLAKSNVPLDRNFYGFKKFSSFLLSIPHILKVVPLVDGQFLLRPASSNGLGSGKSDDISAESLTDKENQDSKVSTKANSETHSVTRMVEEKRRLPVSSYDDVKEKTVEEKMKQVQLVKDKIKEEQTVEEKMKEIPEKKVSGAPLRDDHHIASMKEHRSEEPLDAQESNCLGTSTVEQFSLASSSEQQKSKSEAGIFKRLQMRWFGRSSENENTDLTSPDKYNTSGRSPEKSISEEGYAQATNEQETCGPSRSSSSTALHVNGKSDTVSKSEVSPGFIAKILSWFSSWRNESPVSTVTEQMSKEPKDSRKHEDCPQTSKHEDDPQLNRDDVASEPRQPIDASQSTKHEVAPHCRKGEIALQSRKHGDAPDSKELELLKDIPWSDVESFLRTYRGSEIVLNSASRFNLAKRLKMEGSPALRCLQESDLLQLVDALVSEKKWIREFPTKSPRFSINLPPPAQNSRKLSSIYSSSSQENVQLGVPSPTHKNPFEKPRSEILADCQQLLDELLQENPEGFNMGLFKQKFHDKFGYSLDYQKLGYAKLVSLLQMMPGVKVESSHVLPDRVVYAPGIRSLGSNENSAGSDSDMSDSPPRDEDAESPWEELGPVSNSNLSKQEEEFGLSNKNNKYEPSVAEDDELSDTEDESSPCPKTEDRSRSNVNDEDSSLLQILNSWYSIKEEGDPKDHDSDVEGLVDCSNEESRPSGSSSIGIKDDASSKVNVAWTVPKPQKKYNFVSESSESKKDQLIDGILGTLKKSGESRMQS